MNSAIQLRLRPRLECPARRSFQLIAQRGQRRHTVIIAQDLPKIRVVGKKVQRIASRLLNLTDASPECCTESRRGGERQVGQNQSDSNVCRRHGNSSARKSGGGLPWIALGNIQMWLRPLTVIYPISSGDRNTSRRCHERNLGAGRSCLSLGTTHKGCPWNRASHSSQPGPLAILATNTPRSGSTVNVPASKSLWCNAHRAKPF